MCRNIPRFIIMALCFYFLCTTRMNVPVWRLTCKLENRKVREVHQEGQMLKLQRTYTRHENEKHKHLTRTALGQPSCNKSRNGKHPVAKGACYKTCMFIYTGFFISPSGIYELDCATTKTDTAERSISIGRESLQVFFCTRGLGVLPGSTARGQS